MTYLQLLAGLALLTFGGNGLVKGASGLARSAGISHLVIGLTVVAFGTSAPELMVSVLATVRDQPDLAVGNVVGSNIFNVLLILGVCALLRPLTVAHALVWRDVPIMVGASLLLLVFAMDGAIVRWEGAFMFAALLVFVIYTVRAGKREAQQQPEPEDSDTPPTSLPRDLVWVFFGLAGLMVGSNFLVDSATTLAQQFGISDAVIGLTIVAAGTSLPEVAASIAATVRGQRDIAVGNVIGSNIFNILCILGLTGLIAGPAGVAVSPEINRFDIPAMTGVALLCVPLVAPRHRLGRVAGATFLFYYVAYILTLVALATSSPALQAFSNAVLAVGIPLTIVVITAYVATSRRDGRGPESRLPEQ